MVRLDAVSKAFRLYRRPSDRLKELVFKRSFHTEHHALRGVSFEVADGEVLGIIGQNGAGKSTLLKLLTGVLLPDTGRISVDGKVTGVLELGTGFNMELSGLQNVYVNGMLLGMPKEEISAKLEAILTFAGLGAFIHEPVRTYSSGMVMRLAFAIAIHAEPTCFVIDEALAVGDAQFQQKCMDRVRAFREAGGAIIFVSHDLNAVKMLCDRVVLLDKGRVLDIGDPDSAVNQYNFLLAKNSERHEALRFEPQDGQGYGTLEAEIVGASIAGEAAPGRVLSAGEQAWIKLRIKAWRDLAEANVGIHLRDRFGQEIYGTNTLQHGKTVNLRAGREYTITYSAPMNLGPGKYTIGAAVVVGSTHHEHCAHWVDVLERFEISGIRGPAFTGLCRLDMSIAVQEDGGAAALSKVGAQL